MQTVRDAMIDALKELLEVYSTGADLSYCPLCRVMEHSELAVELTCKGCIWSKMTGLDCEDYTGEWVRYFYGEDDVVPPSVSYLRRGVTKDKELNEAWREHRIDQIKDWIIYLGRHDPWDGMLMKTSMPCYDEET